MSKPSTGYPGYTQDYLILIFMKAYTSATDQTRIEMTNRLIEFTELQSAELRQKLRPTSYREAVMAPLTLPPPAVTSETPKANPSGRNLVKIPTILKKSNQNRLQPDPSVNPYNFNQAMRSEGY